MADTMTVTEPAGLEPDVCANGDGRPVVETGGKFGKGTYCESCLDQRRADGRARARDGKAPTRTRRTRTPRESAPSTPRQSRASLSPRLQSLLGTIGMAVFVVNQADGMAIMQGAVGLADALDALARENPQVRKVLEAALQTSAWSGVIVASASIVVPILSNHDLLPAVALPFTVAPPASADDATPSEPAHFDSAPGGTGAFG